jgi:hypothetical protein
LFRFYPFDFITRDPHTDTKLTEEMRDSEKILYKNISDEKSIILAVYNVLDAGSCHASDTLWRPAYISFLQGLIEEELAIAKSYRKERVIDRVDSHAIHACRRRLALIRQELLFMDLPERARLTAEDDSAMIYCGRA